jgi:hypothetical protein
MTDLDALTGRAKRAKEWVDDNVRPASGDVREHFVRDMPALTHEIKDLRHRIDTVTGWCAQAQIERDKALAALGRVNDTLNARAAHVPDATYIRMADIRAALDEQENAR